MIQLLMDFGCGGSCRAWRKMGPLAGLKVLRSISSSSNALAVPFGVETVTGIPATAAAAVGFKVESLIANIQDKDKIKVFRFHCTVEPGVLVATTKLAAIENCTGLFLQNSPLWDPTRWLQ